MNKIFAEKPGPGVIGLRISNASDMAKEKALILSEADKPDTYTYKDLEISIQSHKYLEDGRLKVIAEATKEGVSIPVDNPLYFINPPTSVPDGTFRKEMVHGEELDIDNFKEDAQEALKQIVGQTISLITN